MRAPARALLGLSMALTLATMAACKKRFDGTCKIDRDCLEFQKCASGVCVRAKPIFDSYVPPATPQPQPINKKPTPKTSPAQPQEDAPPPVEKTAPPKPELGPAVPRPSPDPQSARRFRLDA